MICKAKHYAPVLMDKYRRHGHKGPIGAECVGCKEKCRHKLPAGARPKPGAFGFDNVYKEDKENADTG